MMHAVWIADLIVEQAREDEGDGCGASAADICEHSVQTGDIECCYVAQDDNDGRDQGKPEIGHWRSRRTMAV